MPRPESPVTGRVRCQAAPPERAREGFERRTRAVDTIALSFWHRATLPPPASRTPRAATIRPSTAQASQRPSRRKTPQPGAVDAQGCTTPARHRAGITQQADTATPRQSPAAARHPFWTLPRPGLSQEMPGEEDQQSGSCKAGPEECPSTSAGWRRGRAKRSRRPESGRGHRPAGCPATSGHYNSPWSCCDLNRPDWRRRDTR